MAKKLLETEFYNFKRQQLHAADSITRCTSYSLPEEIANHVDFVAPTTRFPMSSSLRVSTSGSLRGAAALAAAGQVTPHVISSLYKTSGATDQGASKGNKLAIASFLGQYFSHSDLLQFFKNYAPDAVNNVPTMYGYNDDSNPGLEAQLDVEYAFSTAAHVPGQAWNTAGQQPGNPENEPFLKWLHNITALPDSELPQVVSVSYGDNEDGVDFQYAQRVNVEFQKLGARGTSILFSSGDGGVSGGQAQPCPGGKFTPTFPAGSPFVTAVGGTQLQGPESETAAGLSSGGFSNYWARPSYQDEAVEYYLRTASGLPDPSHYNTSATAAFPDVSALAEGFQVVYFGSPTTVAGTSCASPTFAGVVALVNGARLTQGKPPMGWLNPWLYKNGKAFTDITTGSNPGCNTNGFPAAEGWDPVTGWGTPDYTKFVAAAMQK